MKQKGLLNYRVIVLLIMGLVSLFLAATMPGSIRALPPRPTVEPAKAKKLPGATIRLQVSGVTVGTAGVWTKIQWVDASGDWHDVDGWQGTVEPDGTQTWWGGPEHMGAGPFRWLVLSAQDGDVLAMSDSFHLPDINRTVTVVVVAVA